MRTFKRIACAAVAACFAFSLTLTGCSTPEYAMTVDGRQYTTGEYLAYLYNVYYSMAQNMAMYRMYGMDPWAQTVPYGEGDSAENISTAEFIKRTAQDTIIRQKAIENLLDQKKISLDAEKLAEVEKTLADIPSNAYLAYGFNNESFAKMYKATQLNEWSLFYGIYDKGGVNPMSEEEIRQYFDDNFLSFKIIEFQLVDTSNQPLDDDVIQDYRDRLDKYLAEFEKLGITSDNFDTIIEMKEEDDTPDDTGDEDGDEDTSSDSSDVSDTSGSTTSTTTAATSEGTTTTTTGSDSTEDGDGEENADAATDPNRQDIDANIYGDEDFTNAVKKVEIGTASIQEYKKNGTTDTIALIYRMDPQQDREDGKDFFAEKRSDIIYGAKYEEYDKEVTDYIKTLEVSYVDRAIKACKPENFEAVAENNA